MTTRRSQPKAHIQPLRHRCAGTVWTLALDRRGVGEAAFCRARAAWGRAADKPEVVSPREVRGELERRRKAPAWVMLGPWSDAFVPGAEQLRGPALELAEALLQRGIGVVLRTRGDLAASGGLTTLARRHGDLLRVEVSFFSGGHGLNDIWEGGVGGLHGRVGLVKALQDAGADTGVRIGPLIPFINDEEWMLRDVVKLARQARASEITPYWVADGPGLIAQVEREVSRSRARVLDGWFRLGEQRHGERSVPVARRLGAIAHLKRAAGRFGMKVVTCRCSGAHDPNGCCVVAPSGTTSDRPQLDLFASA